MNISSQAKRALVVFSGGQDSTTCLYWALKHFKEVRTLTFDYGQRHRIELECAKKIAQFAAVPHEVLSVGTFAELGGNALTGDEEVQAHQENIIDEPHVQELSVRLREALHVAVEESLAN